MDTNALVAPSPRRNRRHAPEFKARVIAACLEPGVSIAAVALANGLNANFVRTWVKAYRDQQRRSRSALVRTVYRWIALRRNWFR